MGENVLVFFFFFIALDSVDEDRWSERIFVVGGGAFDVIIVV